MRRAAPFHVIPVLLGLLVLSAVLAGCGGSSGGSAGTGTVALFLTDAPTDGFEHVNVTFTRVEAVGAGGTVTLSDDTATFDLLALRDATTPFVTAPDIPAGEYAKLRLHVSSVELVPAAGPPVAARVPNGFIDVVASGPFRLEDGKALTALLDIDASLSIHVVEAQGGGLDYIFRPVVFVRLDAPETWGRRVLTYGPVRDVDVATSSFELYTYTTGASPAVLPGIPASGSPPGFTGYDRVLPVLASDASIFDNTGNVASLSVLREWDWVTVTAIPRVVPDAHDLDGDGNRAEEIVRLDAELIQAPRVYTGDWGRTGIVTGVGTDGSFTVARLPGRGDDGLPDPVVVAPLPQGRIFGWWGAEKRWSDIAPGNLVTVTGFWDGTLRRLRAAGTYWFTGQGTGTPVEGLEGVIVSLDFAQTSLLLAPTGRSGGPTDPVTVRLLPPCGLTVVTAWYTGYVAAMGIDMTDLQPGQTACLFGWKAGDGIVYAWSLSAWPDDQGIPMPPW